MVENFHVWLYEKKREQRFLVLWKSVESRFVESPFYRKFVLLPKIRFTENSFRRMTFYIEFTIRRIPFYTENGKNDKNASTLKIHIAINFKVKEKIIK